jgi:hypothetical protein
MDFNFEVSRSLAACQGTLLLVDAAQGIQAQTVANFYLAYGQDITIIPVINKVPFLCATLHMAPVPSTMQFVKLSHLFLYRLTFQLQNQIALPIRSKWHLSCQRAIVFRYQPSLTWTWIKSCQPLSKMCHRKQVDLLKTPIAECCFKTVCGFNWHCILPSFRS